MSAERRGVGYASVSLPRVAAVPLDRFQPFGQLAHGRSSCSALAAGGRGSSRSAMR